MSEMWKPCPFCGGEAELCYSEVDIFCRKCNVMQETEMWNTRPIEDALQARAEKAEAMLKNVFFVSAKLYSRLNKTSKDGSQLENELQKFAKYYTEWIQENEDEYA